MLQSQIGRPASLQSKTSDSRPRMAGREGVTVGPDQKKAFMKEELDRTDSDYGEIRVA